VSDLPENPAAMKSLMRGSAAQFRDRIEHRAWIIGAISSLFSCYWQDANPSPRLLEEQARAWANDLERSPRDVIERAITRWRCTEARKPTPAEMIKRCHDEMPKPMLAPPPPEPERRPPTPEEKARVQALLAKAGFIPRRFGGGEED